MVARNYFVEVGRVALVNYGADNGKFVVIVDVVDGARALVDGPTSGVSRQTMPFKWLSLTNIKLPIARSVRSNTLARQVEECKIAEQVAATSWGKKLAIKEKRAAMNDFDRFKVMILKKTRTTLINKAFNGLVKDARKSGALKA